MTSTGTVLTPINIAAIVVLLCALIWRIYQTSRAPRLLLTWAVTITILCVALSYAFMQPWSTNLFGPAVARLLNNALLSAGLCSLLVFFLGSAVGPRRYVRAFLELVPLAAAIALMVIALRLTPMAQRGASLGPDTVHDNGIALFYLGAGLYLIYGLFGCVTWINRYQRRATDSSLRTGLRLAGFGLASAGTGAVLRAVYLIVAWPGGPLLNVLLLIGAALVVIGSLCFLAGICYPGVRARIAAFGRRGQHRRDLRELDPLWTALARSYPNIVLREAPARPLDFLRPRNVHRRYYRRVIEIRDGLVQLSPYLDTDLTALATGDPARAAAELSAALTRHADGAATDHKAHLVLPGGAADIEADVQPLLALSRAMRLVSTSSTDPV